MAVTDLTSYTWFGNETLSLIRHSRVYGINFNCFGDSYTGFDPGGQGGDKLLYDSTSVYFVFGQEPHPQWSEGKYRIIQITGGQDTTNTDLIVWLEANGTLYDTSYDLTQLSLDSGTHEITVKAKTATAESDFSEAKEYIVE